MSQISASVVRDPVHGGIKSVSFVQEGKLIVAHWRLTGTEDEPVIAPAAGTPPLTCWPFYHPDHGDVYRY